jgi:hypothetical protein
VELLKVTFQHLPQHKHVEGTQLPEACMAQQAKKQGGLCERVLRTGLPGQVCGWVDVTGMLPFHSRV